LGLCGINEGEVASESYIYSRFENEFP